jgi:hypothetical protein
MSKRPQKLQNALLETAHGTLGAKVRKILVVWACGQFPTWRSCVPHDMTGIQKFEQPQMRPSMSWSVQFQKPINATSQSLQVRQRSAQMWTL